MYKRLIILCAVILAALCGLVWLGHHAKEKWAQGLEGARLGEFAEVAEQIRQDVKRKLDDFIRAEQDRPYSDYLYFYVPENNVNSQQQQLALLRSPLGEQFENDIAYGYFQVEPDGSVVTPYYRQGESQPDAKLLNEANAYIKNVRQNLLPTLSTVGGTFRLPARELKKSPEPTSVKESQPKGNAADEVTSAEQPLLRTGAKGKSYPIESLKAESQEAKVLTQQRSVATSNVSQQMEQSSQQDLDSSRPPLLLRKEAAGADARQDSQQAPPLSGLERSAQGGIERPAQRGIERSSLRRIEGTHSTQSEVLADRMQTFDSVQSLSSADRMRNDVSSAELPQKPQSQQPAISNEPQTAGGVRSETVQIRIEPFVPVVVPEGKSENSIFGGQIFLLRHVQIEDRHLLQGFQLNEEKLIEQVRDSAQRFMREGMTFELAQATGTSGTLNRPSSKTAYTAVLDFGFGDLVMHLMEIDPARIGNQISQLRNWYIGITATVTLAVTLAMISLWYNVRTQVRLAQQKDEFISAVSHELRTPLTSIRMYSEMLEKNWVKSQEKLGEYYRTMRQESERLSRLIENVLDFSKIQKGKKKYAFNPGDINCCIGGVVEMMRPYAAQHGFSITTDLGQVGQTSFDKDAVTQIVVNLLDNAIKYARTAQDKTIIVRTASQQQFTIIEVEDHGPGIPHRQRKKVFDQFYNYGAEISGPAQSSATAQPGGTGLGLTLVKRFAEAHNGFVEIISAKPTGTIFRVGLAARV